MKNTIFHLESKEQRAKGKACLSFYTNLTVSYLANNNLKNLGINSGELYPQPFTLCPSFAGGKTR